MTDARPVWDRFDIACVKSNMLFPSRRMITTPGEESTGNCPSRVLVQLSVGTDPVLMGALRRSAQCPRGGADPHRGRRAQGAT